MLGAEDGRVIAGDCQAHGTAWRQPGAGSDKAWPL